MTIRTSLIEYFGETEGDVDVDPEVVGNSDASEAEGE